MAKQLYGFDEPSVQRIGKALAKIEAQPPGSIRESHNVPEMSRNRYYPFGNSFAFGIVSAPTSHGHFLMFSQGFVHSPAENQPVLIDAVRYYITPINADEKFFHVFVRFDTAKLTIVQTTSLGTFAEPSYHMAESPITVDGAACVNAVASTTQENEVDWANVQLLYSIKIKNGGLIKVLRADGAVSVKPDTEATADDSVIRKSVEIGTNPRCYQVYGFDGDSQVVDGLASLLESDIGTGEITAKTGSEKYEMLVRVRDASGNIRVIGYMSIGTPPNPEDPTDPANFEECGDEPYPGDTDAGEGYTDDDTPYPGDLDEEESVDDPGDDPAYPGKQNVCW